MPVTVKLSRKFYETFGDDLANELVEWLAMDICLFKRIASLAFGSG